MSKEKILNKFGGYLFLAIILFAPFFFVGGVSAATIFLNSSAKKVDQGKTFTVKAYVNTQDKFVNNVESSINFPSDLLEVLSVNSSPSIFSLWVENPQFSNSGGVVTFNGGVPNPGYSGGAGQMVSVVFKAKKSGVASIYFSGAAVRENDGMGTDILSGQSGLDITISGAPPVEEVVPSPTEVVEPVVEEVIPGEKELPTISVYSNTHPDQNAWYSLKDAVLNWNTPSSAQSVQIVFGPGYNTVPDVKVDLSTKQKELVNMDDGVSFFNIRYKSGDKWSRITRYKLQIDSVSPYDLSLGTKDDDGRVGLLLKASDLTSGIKKYQISFDGSAVVEVMAKPTGEAEYVTTLSPGRHEVLLTAYDQAGNRADFKTNILIVPNTPPEISNYSSHIKNGDRITAQGITPYSKANLTVTLKSISGNISNYDIRSDDTGHFEFGSEPIEIAGIYEMWAVIKGDNGVVSPPSRVVNILVDEPLPFLSLMSSYIFSLGGLIIFLILLLIILTIVGWYKYFILRLQYKMLEKRYKQSELEFATRSVKKPIVDSSRKISSKKKLN